MSNLEIDIIESILLKLNPQKCLEWGSGFSTIYFPHFISNDAIWISVEHNTKWHEKIKKAQLGENVSLYNIGPNKYPWTDKYRDGDYNDLVDYINFPQKFKNFDFILIDGRARSSCILKAHDLIDPFGIVVLHDANRKYYHSNFSVFENYTYLKDNKIINGGLWIGGIKKNPIEYLNFLNIKNTYQIFQKNSDNYITEKIII